MFTDCLDIGGLGQERTHHLAVALGVEAEIVKRVGMIALDDRVGLGRQLGHEASRDCCDKIRSIPVSAVRSQSGRYDSSYSTS